MLLKRFHQIEIPKYISPNFLTLSIDVKTLTSEEIRATYTREIAERLITAKDDANFVISQGNSNDLYIPLRHDFYITKNPKKADLLVGIDNNSEPNIKIIKELQNPNDKYQLSFGNVVKAVDKQLESKSIKFIYESSNNYHRFNKYTLDLFLKFYNIKDNKNIIEHIKKQNKKR